MSSYHKPKVFRSVEGCCICKAKSSSSRFTDSGKYQSAFQKCFKIQEDRQGEICNACVLIVKRWRVLPSDTKKNWNHVVDSREGPGGSKVTFRNVKKRPEKEPQLPEKFEKIRKKKPKLTKKPESNPIVDMDTLDTDTDSENVSGFIDLSYFKRKKVCCGFIYEGMAGEIIIDQKLFSRCPAHSSSSSTSSISSVALSETSSKQDTHIIEDTKSVDIIEESDDNVDTGDDNLDIDSLSFYSDDTTISKNIKDDQLSITTDTDEGFFDKSELRRHLEA